jgi:hypothetical protein
MARLLPITIKTAPPLKKVLTREEALHELRERGLDPELINHLRRLPFPEEEKSHLEHPHHTVTEPRQFVFGFGGHGVAGIARRWPAERPRTSTRRTCEACHDPRPLAVGTLR